MSKLWCWIFGHEWQLIKSEYYDAVMHIETYKCEKCGKILVQPVVEYL